MVTYMPLVSESMAEVRARLVPFLHELIANHGGKSILCVTHSGIIRLVDSIAINKSLDEIWDRVPTNGCIVILRASKGGSLAMVRDFHVGLESTTASPV